MVNIRETSTLLYGQRSTDGLPVIPPTEERVEEMLRATDLPRDDELCRLGNREGQLTVENLATNAVMAGCNPTHIPVLIAGAKALAHPESNSIQTSVSTGSWAYLWVINGPVREALGIESGSGAWGPRSRTNRLLGRALGLIYKNTALIHPGEKDMGVMGSPFKFSLITGENEERSPWEPLHVSDGYDVDDSTITFGGPNSFVQYRTPTDAEPHDVLKEMVYNTPPSMSGKERESYMTWVTYAMSPDSAERLSEQGLSKHDVKEYLCENVDVAGHDRYRGFLSENESTSVPPMRFPQYAGTELLKLPVIGGDGRDNAVIGNSLGGPVTEQITFPGNWETLLKEYSVPQARDSPSNFYEWVEETWA